MKHVSKFSETARIFLTEKCVSALRNIAFFPKKCNKKTNDKLFKTCLEAVNEELRFIEFFSKVGNSEI